MNNLKQVSSTATALFILCICVLVQCGGDEHHNDRDHAGEHTHAEKHEPGNYGKGMAVTVADREKGIQLSLKSLRTTGIATASLSIYRIAGSRYRVPNEALIHYEDRTEIYLLRDGWFMPSPVTAVHETAGISIITISAPKATDRIVIKKTAIVRLAQLEAFGASGHGHGH